MLLSLSAPAVPGTLPPIAIPYPGLLLFNGPGFILILQFLIVSFEAPAPVPKLTNEITVGEATPVFIIVKLLSVPPLLLPSIVTYFAPFNFITLSAG